MNIWSPKWMTWSSWVVEGPCGYKGFRSKALARSRRKFWPSATGPLELQPPLQLEDIEVAHRLPRPADRTPKPPASQEHPTPGSGTSSSYAAPKPPRTVIIKFMSRRIKLNAAPCWPYSKATRFTGTSYTWFWSIKLGCCTEATAHSHH